MNFLLALGSKEINEEIGKILSYNFFENPSNLPKLDRFRRYKGTLLYEYRIFSNYFHQNKFFDGDFTSEVSKRKRELEFLHPEAREYIKSLEFFFKSDSSNLLKVSLIFYLGILEKYFIDSFYNKSKEELDYFKINKYRMLISMVSDVSKRIIDSLSSNDHTFFLSERKLEMEENRKIILDFLDLKFSSLKTF